MGDQWCLLRKPLIRRNSGTHSLNLHSSYLSPRRVVPPPSASLLFSRLSWLAATGPTLYFLHFSSSHPSLPFPTWRLQLLCAFLRLLASLPPSPILSSFPFPSSSPFPSPLLLSFPSPLPSPFPSCVCPRVSTLVPAPIPAPVLVPVLRPEGVCVCVCVCVCVYSLNCT